MNDDYLVKILLKSKLNLENFWRKNMDDLRENGENLVECVCVFVASAERKKRRKRE